MLLLYDLSPALRKGNKKERREEEEQDQALRMHTQRKRLAVSRHGTLQAGRNKTLTPLAAPSVLR